MIPSKVEQLLARFNGKPGASALSIDAAQRECGVELPDDYVTFMMHTNGGEGFIGSGGYVVLWSIEELGPLNKAYEVGLNARGLLLFGSDGGGEAYAFDGRSGDMLVVRVPFVPMERQHVQSIARRFLDFLEVMGLPRAC